MIRQYTLADRAIALQLLDEFYHSSAVLHAVPSSHYHQMLDTVQDNSPYAHMYMIEYKGEVVGYMQLSLTHNTEAGGLQVLLEEIYIVESARGNGLGGDALQYIVDNYPHARRIRLEVCHDNTRAIALYRAMGFEQLRYHQYVLEPSNG